MTDMAKQIDEEDLGDSWSQYTEELIRSTEESTEANTAESLPQEGEQCYLSPIPEEVPSAKNPSKKSRKKSVSKKMAIPVEKCDVRLTVLFPDTVIQHLKIVALAEKRSVSDIVRHAVAGYVNPVYNDRLKALFGE